MDAEGLRMAILASLETGEATPDGISVDFAPESLEELDLSFDSDYSSSDEEAPSDVQLILAKVTLSFLHLRHRSSLNYVYKKIP